MVYSTTTRLSKAKYTLQQQFVQIRASACVKWLKTADAAVGNPALPITQSSDCPIFAH